MDWEKIIMDGIYVAIIGVGGIVIGTLLQELLFGKKNSDQINKHDANSKLAHDNIIAANTALKEMLIEAKTKDRSEYDSLSKDQARIIDSVENVRLLPQELMRLNSEVLRLTDDVKRLESENRLLLTDKAKAENEIKRLADENARLQVENEHATCARPVQRAHDRADLER